MDTESPTYYRFTDRDGRQIEIRGDLTMEDMVRMGWSNFRLVKPGSPMAPGDWRCEGAATK